MDSDKMLKNVSNLNDYISITQEMINNSNNMKIQFNMSSVLLLKKVRSLEIEYFNKCEGNGAALVYFDRMVEQPASKTWGLLGKELVALLQYWLDAMRKHLIKHSHHWWTFLKLLLKFIKNIRTKDKSLPDILVEGTAECLLDLATSAEPDTSQRHEILYCLNLCCAESSREIRFALRNRFECFLKLATLMAACGHLPTQYSMLETLLRWLLPRHEVTVRQAAAAGWFPVDVYGKRALQLFLERPWQNFFKDARDFLNAFNATGTLVASFLCRRITVGSVVVVSGTERGETWLDINSYDSSASVVLEPRVLDALPALRVGALRGGAPACECLSVRAHDAQLLQLCRDASEETLVIHTTQPPRLSPSDAAISDACELRVVLSSSTDLRHLDKVLRDIFTHKYQVLLDLNKPKTSSPQERDGNNKNNYSLEEDTRFSHPIEVQKRKRSGFMVRSRHPVAWKSPSTASTSSLAQLHEKLASLPQYKFDKEAVHVCALPELSTVTEVSEADDRQSLLSTSTFKINRPFGVCYKNNKSSDRNSQSDGEVHNKTKVGRYLSPAAKDDEHSTSCLLVATIGSADESVINDTIERLAKNKEFHADNIVDLLVQEALQKDFADKDLRDSGINTGDNRKTQEPTEINSEAIENTPTENPPDLDQNKGEGGKACTVISNTTTDESNDVVYDTPLNFVNVRKRNLRTKIAKEKVIPKSNEGQIFNVKEVEDFFSQHISENNRGEIVISPTLARKINESSSESEQFEDCLMVHEDHNLNVEQIDVYDIDIIECLNSIVDKVCSDFEKCTELLNRDATDLELIGIADNNTNISPIENVILPLKDVSNIEKNQTEEQTETIEFKETDTKRGKSIKLKFNTKRIAKSRGNAKKKKNKLELEPASDISPIKEVSDGVIIATAVRTPENTNKSPLNVSSDFNSTLARRKRKLYSPKDEGNNERVIEVMEMDDDKTFKNSKIETPKYNATSYKDIEMDRQKRVRQPRSRKSRTKSESSPSPRTKKRDHIFNQLKEKVECPDPVMVVDKKVSDKDLAVYNFTSDSEDEDFKRKKIEVQKRISSTTIASGDSIISTRHGRPVNRVNYSENKSSDDANKKNAPKPKRHIKRKKTQPKSRLEKPVTALIDEKIRDAAPEELNTSLVVDKPSKLIPEDPKLALPVKPQMEPIPDETITDVKETNEKPKKPIRKNKKTDLLSLKKEKNNKLNTLNIEKDNDDRTISPLPGLNVETMPVPNDDPNDSVSANMLQKFKKIYQDGSEAYINESNTTQNLLSDVERINYSPIPLNLTDELNEAGNYSKFSDISNEITEVPLKYKKKTNCKEKVIDLSVHKKLNTKSENTIQINKEKAVKLEKISKNETQQEINLPKISDDKSELSIATVGKSPITAHGDSDEHPPNSELLTEKIKPRDLDIEYMDQSMKDYFDRLRAEVNDIPTNVTRRDSIDSGSTRILICDDRLNKNRSPVVSVARLSLDDISKWLPSRRNSTDSSCSKTTKETQKQNNAFNKNVMKNPDSTSDPVSHNDNSPIQKIDKISIEFDFGNNEVNTKREKSVSVHLKNKKKLNCEEVACLLNNNSDECDNLEGVKAKEKCNGKKSKNKNNTNLANVKNLNNSKWLRSRGHCIETRKSSSDSISPVREIQNTTPKKPKQVQASQQNRKSLISPIKLFDDFRATNDSSSATTVKKLESVITNLENELKHDANKASVFKLKRNEEVSSFASKTSTKEADVSRLKRKSKSPVISYVKRIKVDEPVVSITDSGPSVSSVDEWFRRNAPTSKAENVSASFRESIENVMEKLDTTLVEIHQNTSRKFIHMFVDAQKQLGSLKQERRGLYRSVASDILAQVAKLLDDKFADLDRRSQEMDAQFMEQLKTQASSLIREDCKKKQAMVSLLREDLNAMLARVDKKGRGETL